MNPRSSVNPENTSSSFGGSVKWAFALQLVQQGAAAIISLALAALLGPREFGVISMALVYISLIQLVLEQGMNAALIQRKDLTNEHLNSVFWLNILLSIVLMAASLSLSDWWARVNRLEELATVINWLSWLIFIQGLSIVQSALLQREKKFKALAIRGGSAAVLGGVIGIVVALLGYGWKALVIQNLSTAIIGVALLWRLTSWRPAFRFSWPHASEILRFSGGVFLGKIAITATNKSDGLLIGLFFGPVAAGLYRLAQRLESLVFDTLTRPIMLVALPFFSENQDDVPKLRAAFFSCIRIGTLLTVPALAGLAACADLITLALGPDWQPARYALMILCLVGILKTFTLFTGSLLMARGRLFQRAVMLWIIGFLNPAAFFVVAMLLRESDAQTQASGMAVATLAVIATVFLPINMWLCRREVACTIMDILVVLKVPVISALAGAGICAGLSAILRNHINVWYALSIVVIAGAATIALTLRLMDPHILSELKSMLSKKARPNLDQLKPTNNSAP